MNLLPSLLTNIVYPPPVKSLLPLITVGNTLTVSKTPSSFKSVTKASAVSSTPLTFVYSLSNYISSKFYNICK